MEAVAVLNNPDLGITGTVVFVDEGPQKGTMIKIQISGLEPNTYHGFHIHEGGDLRMGCESMCSHWNPYCAPHGGPDDPRTQRHAGDLGNVKANNKGVVNMVFHDKLIRLRGKHSVVGRGVILHADPDDLGRGGDEESLKTGNSGKRIACGVIGWVCH